MKGKAKGKIDRDGEAASGRFTAFAFVKTNR